MSTEQAQKFMQRFISDEAFRDELEAAPMEERRSILEREGYGDVKLRHLSEAMPESAGGELSDEEFAAVAGGVGTLTSVTVAAGASFAGSATAALSGIAAMVLAA